MSEQSDALLENLRPYRATPGILAAMLIQRDGFVVAADADDSVSVDAVAAQVAAVIDVGARLATELGQETTRYLTAELETVNVVLAPFGDELMLVLVGEPSRPDRRVPHRRSRRLSSSGPASIDSPAAAPARPTSPQKGPTMEDALEQLAALARKESRCTRCSETAGAPPPCRPRRRAPARRRHGRLARPVGSRRGRRRRSRRRPRSTSSPRSCRRSRQSRERVYVTTLAEVRAARRGRACDRRVRGAGNCFDYLSREISITTPHFILAVGEETARFVLRKLFRDRPYAPGDALELRVFDNPAFKVVPVATPEELHARDAKAAEGLHGAPAPAGAAHGPDGARAAARRPRSPRRRTPRLRARSRAGRGARRGTRAAACRRPRRRSAPGPPGWRPRPTPAPPEVRKYATFGWLMCELTSAASQYQAVPRNDLSLRTQTSSSPSRMSANGVIPNAPP